MQAVVYDKENSAFHTNPWLPTTKEVGDSKGFTEESVTVREERNPLARREES